MIFNIFFYEAFLILNNTTNSVHHKTDTRGSAVAWLMRCAALPDKMWVQKRNPGVCCRPWAAPGVLCFSLLPGPEETGVHPALLRASPGARQDAKKKERNIFLSVYSTEPSLWGIRSIPLPGHESRQTHIARARRKGREEGRLLCLVAVSCQIRLAVS